MVLGRREVARELVAPVEDSPRIAPRFRRSGWSWPCLAAAATFSLPSGWMMSSTAFRVKSPSTYASMLQQ
jgi:hypothetical protein